MFDVPIIWLTIVMILGLVIIETTPSSSLIRVTLVILRRGSSLTSTMLDSKLLLERWTARGHPNVRSSHKTTLEFTKDEDLTLQGDCIIGIGSSLAPAEFKPETKELLRSPQSFLLEIEVQGEIVEIRGIGDPGLTLEDKHEMVFRKSPFVSDRTVLVNCDTASGDLDSRLKELLKLDETEISIRLFLLG
jgi:hypothetical protein